MKRLCILLAAALLTGIAVAQQARTMYVMKNGVPVSEFSVADIDSIIFYNPSVPPVNPPQPPPGDGKETGLYLGIIGFNNNLSKREIALLNKNNKSQFESFVSALTMQPATGLYYAVDNAINMLQAANLPDDLVNVSIVTFTDGLDNFSIELNSNYNSRDAYRDAVRNRISDTKIKNLSIQAYSVGVRGNDVVDVAAFSAALAALASDPDKVKEVANMSEVNNTFSEIANSLTNVNQSMSLDLKITGGYDDQVKIRFTFDNVTDAAASSSYIEGTFRRSGASRSLENIVYQGLSSSSGVTVSGASAGGYVTFTFNDVSNEAGSGLISTNNVQQWEYVLSQSRWQRNSEFGQTGDIETTIDRKSAVIMLVLDCTTSLGATDFSSMKNAANNFINVLASNTESSGGDNGGDIINPPPVVGESVTINGVRWATRNVDAPGTFAATPESPGMFYQWNRRTGWPATGSVTGWNSSIPSGTTWEKANDPSPSGWRVPTSAEIQSLLDANKVSNEWTTQNGVSGRKFTDRTTGNSIFLPAAGFRSYSNGTLDYAGSGGGYWSSTQYGSNGAYGLGCSSSTAVLGNDGRSYGFCVRPVAE